MASLVFRQLEGFVSVKRRRVEPMHG
jgi:hypothetical protein